MQCNRQTHLIYSGLSWMRLLRCVPSYEAKISCKYDIPRVYNQRADGPGPTGRLSWPEEIPHRPCQQKACMHIGFNIDESQHTPDSNTIPSQQTPRNACLQDLEFASEHVHCPAKMQAQQALPLTTLAPVVFPLSSPPRPTIIEDRICPVISQLHREQNQKGGARNQIPAKTITWKGCMAGLGIGGQVQDGGRSADQGRGLGHCLAIKDT